MEKLFEVLWTSVKSSMELVYQIWKQLVIWWEALCKKPEPEVEIAPLEPREQIHELDVAELNSPHDMREQLSKIIYYYKPKQT